MARKAAQKAAQASPLAGCAIAVSGRFPTATHSALQARLTSLGATIASAIAADTSFLISTEKDVQSNSIKAKSAVSQNIPIVSLDWLEQCESSNDKVDEAPYLLTSNVTSAPDQKKSNGTNKRTASNDASPAASPDPQPPKKQKKTDPKPEPKVGDGQNAKSAKMKIPLDECCPNTTYEVYIGDDGTIFDASLNQTNATANNNKFYRVQLIHGNGKDFRTWTRWGRVGERGQMAMLGNGSLDDAIKNFDKKFKDKSGLTWANRGADPKAGKYAYVEKSYNPDSDDEAGGGASADEMDVDKPEPAKCTLSLPVQQLMELIFNQKYFAETMSALNYDANKLPLGKLSKGTINRGFQALKDLAAVIDDNSLAASTYSMSPSQAIEQLSNRYYSLIPHAFGRNRPPIIQTNDLLKKEIELLESLSDMKEAAAMLKGSLKDDGGIHILDRQFQGLGMEEMVPLDQKSSEFTELADYLNNSKGATHHVSYTVQDIFRIQRNGEFDRFERSPYAKINSDRRLLWHGSRVTNFGGILGQGLRIAPPEAPVSGYMFGKGIYLADMSSKSANYCCSYNSGGTALLLLCEAELGDPMQELTSASYSAGDNAKAKGMYSTWGKGRTGPSKWKDAECVHPSLAGVKMPDVSVKPGDTNVQNASLFYNEFIVYDVAQVRLRYLLRVKM